MSGLGLWLILIALILSIGNPGGAEENKA